ncbi:MAG: 3-isopropylmalate dehydrogenase [candidate division KSB1 bacterium]|nr:3-isopropylmalate dehydrogenase [candidate division KSB1 bacterium]MDZ7346735.1 3-isopropylmalate dehydrogenase [candidate division KSB1 bacterium]
MQKSNYRITVLPGDGIGPEVVAEAVKVLRTVAELAGFKVELDYRDVGGAAIDKYGTPLPEETLAACRASDAVLLGAIGAPQYDQLPSHMRPEKGLLGLRAGLGLYANLRPAKIYPALAASSTLKEEVVQDVDLLIVRELTGGVYFGEPRGLEQDRGFNTMIYTRKEVERIARVAFEAAKNRRRQVCSVDKANVLEVSQFWRRIVIEVAAEYPEITLTHMYVDNAAMQLIRNPRQFDVIVTGNLFGDILSDEAAMITGSLGMLPSASLGDGPGMYEPVHGSAPDIAGQNKANPIATIASVAMMLIHSLGRKKEGEWIETAIGNALLKGARTADIARPSEAVLTTTEMGDFIVREVEYAAKG